MDPLEAAVQTIRSVLSRNQVGMERIYLFGSRARGDAGPQSDWDLYVLLDTELPFAQRNLLSVQIKRELARLGIPNDIILQSHDRFERLKAQPGYLAHEVAREGALVA
jgi:predicted nucleotidyltransferase